MEYIDAILKLAQIVVTVVVGVFYVEHRGLRDKVGSLEAEVHKQYVPRDDCRTNTIKLDSTLGQLFREIKSMDKNIEDKISALKESVDRHLGEEHANG